MKADPKTTIRTLLQENPKALSLLSIANVTGLPKKQVVAVLREFERNGDAEASWHEVIYLWEWIGEKR